MSADAASPVILIVDDDRGLARLIERVLRRDGMETATAGTGKEAIDWLAGRCADLMLVDLKLPDLDGKQLMETLRDGGRNIPFLVITGQGDERVAVDVIKSGALDYLVKDTHFIDLIPGTVRRALAHLGQEKRLAAAEAERRRLEQEILAVSEREQRRIGQDLHDGLCQLLTGIDVLVHVLKRRLVHSSVSDSQAVSVISGYLRQAIEQARMLARGLSPVQVESSGLEAALKELATSTTELFKVSCEFQCEKPVAVDDHAKATHLYRIAQEAIGNAIKHGKADRITISLGVDEGMATLRIVDNGGGFPASAEGGPGMGLRSMRYRAGTIGAALEIETALPRGTTVICSFAHGR